MIWKPGLGIPLYRSVVIGLGRIGFSLEGDRFRASPCTHAGSFEAHPDFELVGGYDQDPDSAEEFLKNYPKSQIASQDLLEFLISTRPSVVSVAVSSSSHLEVIKILAEYQNLHPTILGILLEKPVGMNVGEALLIQTLCDEMRAFIVVCHDRRFYTEFQYFKRLIQSKKFGALQHIRIEINCGSFAEGKGKRKANLQFGGPMLHDGTHLVDLVLFLVGDPGWVQAICTRSSQRVHTEDTCLGSMYFKDGPTVSFLCGGQRKYFHFALELGFEKARILHGNSQSVWLRRQKGGYFLEEMPILLPKAKNPYLERLNHLVLGIQGQVESLASVRDGIRTLELIESIYDSARNGGVMRTTGKNPAYPPKAMVGRMPINR